LKNVVIFHWAHRRHAIELRWVREIVTLGTISSVPGAPPSVVGATAHRGAVLPILSPDGSSARPHKGDAAIVVEVGDVLAAIATEGIGEVATLRTPRDAPDDLVDAAGEAVTTVLPGELIEAAMSAIAESRRGPGGGA